MTPMNLMTTHRIEPVRLSVNELAFVYDVQDWVGEAIAPNELASVLQAYRDGLSAKFAGRNVLRARNDTILHS